MSVCHLGKENGEGVGLVILSWFYLSRSVWREGEYILFKSCLTKFCSRGQEVGAGGAVGCGGYPNKWCTPPLARCDLDWWAMRKGGMRWGDYPKWPTRPFPTQLAVVQHEKDGRLWSVFPCCEAVLSCCKILCWHSLQESWRHLLANLFWWVSDFSSARRDETHFQFTMLTQ